MAQTTRSTTVDAAGAGRADRIVQQLVGGARSAVRALFDHGCVTVNGKPCAEPGQPLASGDKLLVRYDPGRRYREQAKPHSHAFRVVFEDEHLIVIDKAAGVLTAPLGRKQMPSVVRDLARYLSHGSRVTVGVAIVHRLDRDTSGLLVFAKNGRICQALKEQFARHKPLREYVALVAGDLEKAKGTFRSELATDDDLNQYSVDPDETGKLAITHYRVEQRLRGATCVRVWLETGRRNQIRVHFAEVGHPVLGDPRYAPELARHPRWRVRRLALHAAVLGFDHPISGRTLRFDAPLPEEMRALLSSPARV